MLDSIPLFLQTFIPLFVAFDVLGVSPIFLSMTKEHTDEDRTKLLRDALITIFSVSTIFLFAGKFIFNMLGIIPDDFRIGGGIVLLLIAIGDLLYSSNKEQRRAPTTEVGIVPIGIPLIMGPAAMTTLMLLVDRFGYVFTGISLALNLLIIWVVLSQARLIVKILGESGAKIFAKVFSLFLVAIAVMMIRVGITNIMSG